MYNWWNLLGAAVSAFTAVISTSIVWLTGIAVALLVLNLGYFIAANIKGENI